MRSLLVLLLGFVAAGKAQAGADSEKLYLEQVKPILTARCYACHGVLKQESGLRLDFFAAIQKGGDGGPVVIPQDADKSPLVARITAAAADERMPPEGEPLKPAEIEAIKSWIAGDASGPADEKPERDPRDHWAFKTPQRPPVPEAANPEWVKNPIDAFIAAGQQQHGLRPQPAAEKRLWLRRVSLDLVGLPPTLAETAAFLADDSAEAADKVVTRLLDSPQYGERWGRHWMDVWRYSDWWGFIGEVRNSQKHIWHWRDWILESLNADKGYDQMLREMLAADELYPNDLDRLRAGGFLARQYFKFNRTSWLDETVEHVSKGMLGLTFNCAKCHDHKYDPISQADYYRLRAVFEPYQIRTDLLPGEVDLEKDGLPPFDCHLDAQTFLFIRGDESNPDRGRVIEPGVPAFLSLGGLKIAPVTLPAEAWQPGLRPFVVEAYVQSAQRRIAAARLALDTAKGKLAELEEAARQAPASPAASPPAEANVAALAASEGAKSGGSEPAAQAVAAPVVGAALSLDEAKLAAKLAEKSLIAAEASAASVASRAVADRIRNAQLQSGTTLELIRAAARAQRIAALAQAEEDAVRAELAVLQAAAEKKPEAEKKLAEAKAAFEQAAKAVETPGETYESLVGARKTLESNLETAESQQKPFPATSTGRRSALTQWITDAKNPLTARVAVNQIWSRHMGRGLAATLFDFGRKGTPPTHPELLDWLAVEFMEHGWSMKHIHRLIVTSNAYRMTSSSAGAPAETLAADPENHFYWRSNSLHMEAQLVRDSLLSLAGELDPTHGGPPVPVADETSRRRSVYFVHSENDHQKFLSMFDDASVLECYRRAESIVPQQALALENSLLASTTAEKITQAILVANPQISEQEFIRAAFMRVLLVEPSAEEQAAVASSLAQLVELAHQENRPDPMNRARTALIHALLNHNDFVTIR